MTKVGDPFIILGKLFTFMVNADRVKVVLLMDGRSVISDVQEAVDRDTGERKAWIFNFPYQVTYDTPRHG